jgi:diguanylate cyclase (GGDEF)-like protein
MPDGDVVDERPSRRTANTGPVEELVYKSERTRVTRQSGVAGVADVICKTSLGPDAVQRVRHETAILERLAGVTGTPQLAGEGDDPAMLRLVDTGGSSLAERLPSLFRRISAALDTALDLSMIVAGMHRRGVIHKDINPGNIVVSDKGSAVLIDYDLATTFAEERPDFTHQSEIIGTLAYLAPEQSGRTGRPVDQRADLYALGATLYAMVTGQPVFGDGDALKLVHDHLAVAPTPPAALNPGVPEDLSRIILRLLEKEPDRRYQSAEGLAHDLSQVAARPPSVVHPPLSLGERDFPLRLVPPSLLVGRDQEIGQLRRALGNAMDGGARGLMVTGAPGVGKTALINELRQMVTGADGWFVSGKFDQYRQDTNSDGVTQALHSLAGLLLAEPETTLAALRPRLRYELGTNRHLLSALVPELAILMDEPDNPDVIPDETTSDPADLERRTTQAELALVRAVVSTRPLVVVIDDLQWATAAPIAFVDAVLAEEDLRGLLLVGAYRDAEVDGAHPLSAMIGRWERMGLAPAPIRLANLPAAGLVALLAAMLRLPEREAAGLAAAVGERTAGNPYDTAELVNALRRDGALVPSAEGWRWDAANLRGYVGTGDVLDLLAARVDRLPPPTQSALEIMACLGGEVDLDLLRTAAGNSVMQMQSRLVPALEDGLLVSGQAGVEQGGTVRFRHDRVMQAANSRLDLPQQQKLHLDLARRLGAASGYTMAAAGQYLPAVDLVSDPDERRHVAGLLRSAATTVAMTNSVATERFLSAATSLIDADSASDDPLRAALDVERHAALYRLGRLVDADELYLRIQQGPLDPLGRVASTWVQISSLTYRARSAEAVALGLDLLPQLGLAVPPPGSIGVETASGFDALIRWVEGVDLATDLRRADIKDPHVKAIATVINGIMSPAAFAAPEIMAWLVTAAWRLWAEHGPCAMLLPAFGSAATSLNVLRGDYRAGYPAVRHVLAFGEARGYEPETSQVRFLFAVSTGHWFGPIEDNIALAQSARDRLIRSGDPHYAGMTYGVTMPLLMDCTPTLDSYAAMVDSGTAFTTRTGNEFIAAFTRIFRQFTRSMRGETDEPGGFAEPTFDEAAYAAAIGAEPLIGAYFHTARGVAAAIFGKATDLARYAAAALDLLPAAHGAYPTAWAIVLRSMALAQSIRTAGPADRRAALDELDERRVWLAERAADAPSNFRHLYCLIEAERAWATGRRWTAMEAFDRALEETPSRYRPWQRALITERAGVFCQEYGLRITGRRLLTEAHHLYEAWGATAKVEQMRRAHGTPHGVGPSATVSRSQSTHAGAGSLDLLAVLQASQALSSETDLDRLRLRVVEVLGAMTGATAVRVLLWNEDLRGWFLSPDGDDLSRPIAVDEAGSQSLLPMTAFRYVERTRKPLLVEDATRDDRFARDPYLAGLDRCSLLVVPIEVQGTPRAVLLLENRLGGGAFSAERLDTVMLIAGQLAVSLDNAMVYASLAQKVAERTEALATTNQQLARLSATDPLTGLANRRHLEDVLAAEWATAQLKQRPVSAAMIDIDYFKRYNDHYGHQSGDSCLKMIASVLAGAVRETDLAARYGGEEFILVLPGADLSIAHHIGQRANMEVAALREPHIGSPIGIVTVSVGVAAIVPSPGNAPEDLIRMADAELYEAKRNGRNRVGAFGG